MLFYSECLHKFLINFYFAVRWLSPSGLYDGRYICFVFLIQCINEIIFSLTNNKKKGVSVFHVFIYYWNCIKFEYYNICCLRSALLSCEKFYVKFCKQIVFFFQIAQRCQRMHCFNLHFVLVTRAKVFQLTSLTLIQIQNHHPLRHVSTTQL